ncbi:MAG: glucosyltransferase domain-containing protein [Acetobacter sp.]|nr:glucosyltransferase domain-containing protein [Acetobacter sp.]
MRAQINNIANFSLKAYISQKLAQADRPFWSAFFAAFAALNILFLFHGAQYLFGDHDWQYIKTGVPLSAGLFEGRFSQFILINLFTHGEILPILNNLIGFAGYSFGIALLAKYWHLPHNKRTYILFALFGAVTPYILSFMYFAFLILPVLSWNAFIIGALIISEKETSFSLKHTLTATILFTLALGGYPPVINLFAVALTTRILITFLPFEAEDVDEGNNNPPSVIATVIPPSFLCHPSAVKQPSRDLSFFHCHPSACPASRQGISHPKHIPLILTRSISNFILALVIYKLCLMYLTHTGAINSSYYNLQITPIAEWGSKTLLIAKDLFKQFTATLPFIPSSYKIATILLTLTAILSLFSLSSLGCETAVKGSPSSLCHPSACPASRQGISISKRLLPLLLIPAIFTAALATLFISTSTTETEFSPRIDFFGLNYAYMAMFALCLHSPIKWIKNLATTLAICIIITSAHSILEAQKVWKLGFTAEQSLYRRILKRYEQSPLFNPNNRYIIIQAGSPAFRHKYYHTAYKYGSDDLLTTSYTPGLNASVMWNYQAPNDYAIPTSYVYTFHPDQAALNAIHTAIPYPAAESTAVGSNWLLTILTSPALQSLKTTYPTP